jgi:DNA-binding NtrC family response regulator
MKQEKILVVDDQPYIRETLTDIITHYTDYQVEAVPNVVSAFKVLRQEPVAMMFLDDNMGDSASGFTMLPIFADFYPKLPIVFMGSTADLREHGDYGNVQVMPKPMDLKELVGLITLNLVH